MLTEAYNFKMVVCTFLQETVNVEYCMCSLGP